MRLSKKIKSFLKDENGIMVNVEAIFLYPLTIFVIFALVYIGLFMFQVVAIQNCSQKIAVLASREISYPGYVDMPSGGSCVSVFGTNAIDWDVNENAKITVPRVTQSTGEEKSAIRPYRYLTTIGKNSNILDGSQKDKIIKIAKSVVDNSKLLASDNIVVEIKADNFFVSQQVEVKISEELPTPGLFTWFQKKSQVSATAFASANDQDEFIRNTDLVFDFAETLAKKLNLDKDSNFGKAIEKVRSFMNKVNGV